ncbi:MAG: hypothetical protein JW741_11750 [Sedimentisphaerales bacterium]|nr:hypothetical protein [Sedimentisphaerales bacterium]
MKMMATFVLCSLLILAPASAPAQTVTGPTVRYEGCDRVTAAVAIDEDTFIAASSDDNLLRVYATTGAAAPLTSFDLSDYLDVDSELPGAIQGATRVGDRIYWITSHSRDEDGRIRPERYRFFATTIEKKQGQIVIEPVGTPSKTLVHRLVARHTMRTLRLDKATRLGAEMTPEQRARLAPSREGLNIEALCASHNSEVLIAFRNPRPLRVITGTPHALIVPVDNADEVIEKGEAPIFGEGVLWDLGGLGIVSFEYSAFHRVFFVVAAPHDNESVFVLYRWSGMKANPPEVVKRFSTDDQVPFPRTIIPFENSSKLLFLGRSVEAPGNTRSFCGYWFQP